MSQGMRLRKLRKGGRVGEKSTLYRFVAKVMCSSYCSFEGEIIARCGMVFASLALSVPLCYWGVFFGVLCCVALDG